MNLIPMPKRMETGEGFLTKHTVCIVSQTGDERLQKALQKLPAASGGIVMEMMIADGNSERYTLTIEQERILLTADGAQGAFYGIQTLRQIFTHEKIPCMYIEDSPDFGYRAFHQDVTRGRIPKIATLKQLVDQMAYYKLNTLQLYSEHVFDFRELKGITGRYGCITAAEIRELDEYCRENFIKLIPSLALFGHLYELLNEEKYQHLRVLKDYKPTNIFWDERAYHHTLDPYNPESFELVKSMLDQCMEMFSSDTVNIGCDETFDLETFKNANPGKLYTEFVRRIAKYLSSKGKKVMMWSDVILENMELIDELPDDITLLTWGYGKKLREKDAMQIAELGRRQILCPGCNTWTRLVEDTDISEINIPGMAKLAERCGAVGVMNTSWGDWGQPCCIELSMYGFLMGAETSWSVHTKIDSSFESRANALYYRSQYGVQTVKELSALATVVSWWHFGAAYSNRICENGNLKVEIPSEETLTGARKACCDLLGRVSAQKWGNENCREEVLVVAEGILLMAEIFSKIAGYPVERTVNTEKWLAKYRREWLREDKESELRNIEAMFRYMDKEADGKNG